MSQENIARIPVKVVETTTSQSVPDNFSENKTTEQQGNQIQPLIALPNSIRIGFVVLLALFMGIGATYFWAVNSVTIPDWVAPLMTTMWVVSGLGALGLVFWVWKQFCSFGTDLSIWAQQLLQGEVSSRMPIKSKQSASRGIREHINQISDDYETLSKTQRQRLIRQKEIIDKRRYYLDVLYDVASSINKSSDLEDLLQRFLHTLTNVVKAKAATVRLLDKNDQMRLVASIGLSDEIIKLEDRLPIPDCLCGKALKTHLIVNADVKKCNVIIGSEFFKDEEDIEMMAIPLQYRGKTLGVYNLFLHRQDNEFLEGEHELLISIGQHLGMAIDQAGVEDDARTLSIIEERTRMAHELHDSLAQTLASLRFKVRLFDDSLNQGDEEEIWHELEDLENTIDDAYSELRSLITHFRAPIDGKGVVHSVKRIAERFERDTAIEVFFYHNWGLENLTRDTEIEVVRIVQEALANIKKHAKAESVRILMTSTEEGHCSVLVEDDGIGLNTHRSEPNQETGDHIGLSVMQERAERINGEIHFESDGDSGTLIQLNFEVSTQSNPVTLNTFKKKSYLQQ